jgi:hypothetical protein
MIVPPNTALQETLNVSNHLGPTVEGSGVGAGTPATHKFARTVRIQGGWTVQEGHNVGVGIPHSPTSPNPAHVVAVAIAPFSSSNVWVTSAAAVRVEGTAIGLGEIAATAPTSLCGQPSNVPSLIAVLPPWLTVLVGVTTRDRLESAARLAMRGLNLPQNVRMQPGGRPGGLRQARPPRPGKEPAAPPSGRPAVSRPVRQALREAGAHWEATRDVRVAFVDGRLRAWRYAGGGVWRRDDAALAPLETPGRNNALASPSHPMAALLDGLPHAA